MASKDQLLNALREADAAGDTAAAERFAGMLKGMPANESEVVTEEGPGDASEGLGSIADPLAQGLSLGWADEAMAPYMAAAATFLPEDMGGVPGGHSFDDYMKNLEGIQEQLTMQREGFEERNPITSGVAEAAGGLLTGGAGLSKLAPEGAGLLKRLITGAGIGGAEGAIYGAGTAEPGERSEGAVEAVPAGMIGGAVGGEVMRGIGKAGQAILNRGDENRQIMSLLNANIPDESTAGWQMKDPSEMSVIERRVMEADGTIELPPPQTTAERLSQGYRAGRILSPDFDERDALKQGFSPGGIASIKNASRIDKDRMLEMLDLMEKGQANSEFAIQNRPSGVLGQSLADRVNFLSDKNKQAGRDLKRVANDLRGQPGDFTEPVDNFVRRLQEDLDVKLNPDLSLDFSEAIIQKNPAARRVIEDVVDVMRNSDGLDAYQGHRLKKIIDDTVEFGKAQTGLRGQTVNVLKKLRRELDRSLDENYPEYNEVNTIFSETRGALDSLQDVAGKKMDFSGDRLGDAMGTLIRRMHGNMKSRVPLLDAIDKVDDVSKKYGADFGDNIKAQSVFVNELDAVFGPVQKTSIRSEFTSGAKDVAGGAGKAQVMSKMAEKAFTALEDISPKAASKAIKKVLER